MLLFSSVSLFDFQRKLTVKMCVFKLDKVTQFTLDLHKINGSYNFSVSRLTLVDLMGL